MNDVILSRDNIVVTRTMARFGNTTYPIASIGAVSVEKNPSPLVKLGIIAILGGIVALIAERYAAGGFITAIGIGMWCLGMWSSGLKLMLRTSSGNQQAYASTDKQFVQALKRAIETAVTERG